MHRTVETTRREKKSLSLTQHDTRQLIKHGFTGTLNSFSVMLRLFVCFFSVLNFPANRLDKHCGREVERISISNLSALYISPLGLG